MYYIAQLVKKRRPFQRAYTIDGGTIHITNTKRAKKRFLQSGIENVVFREEFKSDEIIGGAIKLMEGYDRRLVLEFLESMLKCITEFFHLALPLDEIAIYSHSPDEIVKYALDWTKLVSIVGKDGETEVCKGVSIRRVKRLKKPPSLIIGEADMNFSNIFKVPVIKLSPGEKTKETLSYDTIALKTELFPFEINAPVLMYLAEGRGDIPYTVVSFRKKLPPLFTFG